MTVQEARAEINRCEQEITRAHSSLCSDARSFGLRAKERANTLKIIRTLLPLIISVVGLFFIFTDSAFFGWILVVVGVFVSYKQNEDAGLDVFKVDELQKTLDSIIDSNSEI